MDRKKIAIFGATGYVGLIFVNRLLKLDFDLKLFVRNKRRTQYLKEYKNVQSCDTELSFENIPKLAHDLQECDTIYYLIHSMSDSDTDFSNLDYDLAEIVAKSAKRAQIKQIIYLGGLGHATPEHPLSVHLKSRHLIAKQLASTKIPTTDIRAGIIVGAGSASFEIVRALGRKLPFIPHLAYAKGKCQPIDIDDVIAHLLEAYGKEEYYNKTIEIGMREILTYQEILQVYAKVVLNKNLRIIHIPLLHYIITPHNLAHIIAFVSAIPYMLARPLIDGINSLAIKQEPSPSNYTTMPLACIGYEEAIKKAHLCELEGKVESFWSIPWQQQVLSAQKEKFLYVNAKEKRDDLLQEHRMRIVTAQDAPKIFKECLRVGGEHGYWSPKWMWGIRAFLDKLIGGTGLESGSQAREKERRIGERIDFWIVSDYLDKPEIKVFTLKARLKSPGDSWLQFALVKEDEAHWKFLLRAYFKPRGIKGYLYWYSLWIVHKYIFTEMINNIVKEALKTP